MRRRLFNFTGVVSLVLCVGAVALWARSFKTMDILRLRTASRWFVVWTYRGSLAVDRWDRSEWDPPAPWHETCPALEFDLAWRLYVSATRYEFAGFRIVGRSDPSILSGRTVIAPLPALALALIVMPLWRGFSFARRATRPRAGVCRTCGYNLTGNESGVCPECGAACKAASPAGVSPAAGD